MLLERGSLCVVAALALGCATTNGGTGTSSESASGDGDTDETSIVLSVEGLTDVNPSSATADQLVHPNDYQGMVSAWYFGHAT